MTEPPIRLSRDCAVCPLPRLIELRFTKMSYRQGCIAEKEARIARVQPHSHVGVVEALVSAPGQRQRGADAAIGDRKIWIDVEGLPIRCDALVSPSKKSPEHHSENPEGVLVSAIKSGGFLRFAQSFSGQLPRIVREPHEHEVEISRRDELMAFCAASIEFNNLAPASSLLQCFLVSAHIHSSSRAWPTPTLQARVLLHAQRVRPR